MHLATQPLARSNHGHVLGTLIDKWRNQRLSLRQNLMQLISCQLLPAAAHEQETFLQSLCIELIDYVSSGHFGVYGTIFRQQAEPDQEMQGLLANLYRSIGCSTDMVLNFNTKYETSKGRAQTGSLSEDLNKLTRSLLVRFALEEQLLELSLGSNSCWEQCPRFVPS